MKADWRTAPVRPELRAALAFVEKQTLRPDELTSADAEEAFADGVSRQALLDAARVSALFNMIVRLADSFGWAVPEWDSLLERAPGMLERGYAMGAVRDRSSAAT